MEFKCIFRKEGNVNDILPAFNNRVECTEAHMPGHSADDKIGTADHVPHGFRIGEIGDPCLNAIAREQQRERILIDVCRRNLEFIA